MTYPSRRLQPNHKPVDRLYTDRLRQFTDPGGQFRDLNLPALYDHERFRVDGLKLWRVPDGPDGKTERPLFKEIDWSTVEWEHIEVGYRFGPLWKTFWVKLHVEIPEKWLEAEAIELEWDSMLEALIYNDKGLPLQAFTGGGDRNYFRFSKEYITGKRQTFYIEVACNGMFGNGLDGHPDPNRYFQLKTCDLVLPNLTARRLYWDFWILGDAAREFPGGHWQKYKALTICNDIMDAFDPDNKKLVETGRKLALSLLGGDVDSESVFSHYLNPDKRVDVIGIGNCHIDTAWEWPFAETKRKIVRSWTTQLKICDEYPEFVFVALQMQQFKWLKQSHPEILKKIKEKFATNQFLPIGGSWVENDTNLPNGESLIRQFLVGQRFQFNEFGFYLNIYWLPDTFGYTLQIPQICQHAGILRFLTQKLSWNNINVFPLSTFNWVGLDGSQVLVHMPPANTYTAHAHFGDIVRSESGNKNLGQSSLGLLLYGYGDGGGGPTEEMIEKIRRCRGLANTSGLVPTVHLGSTVDDFYDQVLESTENGDLLPLWNGEMYLEYHRGTYTTQALIKKLERFGEIKLHNLEYLAALTLLLYPKQYKYPKHEIQELWEDLLLCQFHDVFPGSCIGMVYYDEAYPMLTKDLAKMDKLISEVLDVLKDRKRLLGEPVSFFNPSPWERHDVVVDSREIPEMKFWVQRQGLEPGLTLIDITSKGTNINSQLEYPSLVKPEGDSFVLSNNILKATVSKTGVITSLYDIVNDREIVDTTNTKQTRGGTEVGFNQYILVDDEPLNFPAWDTELYSLDKFGFVNSGEVVDTTSDPVELAITIHYKILKNLTMRTKISLQGLSKKTDAAPNFVRFKCDVDWHEKNKFLKVQFPTTIYTATHANYETQFGITQRPTHYNTSWDVAQFEVCHHKFVDLSEYNYGVSILNDCKYGSLVHGNLIRLLLLRSAKAPDDKADMGKHTFEYAVYPHRGNIGMDTVKVAWDFNYRVNRVIPDGNNRLGMLTHAVQLHQQSQGSLVLSHIKRGENDVDVNIYKAYENVAKQKTLVLRVYEALGGSLTGKISFDSKQMKVKKIVKTNALEEDELEELTPNKDGSVDIKLRGFEIATFKVYFD